MQCGHGGGGSNTCALHLSGWHGLLLDGEHKNPQINLYKAWITSDTIVRTLEAHNVSRKLDFLSVDIDSVDFWVLRAILSAGFQPRVVSVE